MYVLSFEIFPFLSIFLDLVPNIQAWEVRFNLLS